MATTATAPTKNSSSKLKKKPRSKDEVTAWALGIASAVWFAIIMIILSATGGVGSYQYDDVMHATLAITNTIAAVAVGIGVVIWGRRSADALWVIIPRLVVVILWVMFMILWFDDILHLSGVRPSEGELSSAEALWSFWKGVPVAGPILGSLITVVINVAALLFLLWLPKGKPRKDWKQALVQAEDNLVLAKGELSANKAELKAAQKHKDDTEGFRETAETRVNDAATALKDTQEEYNEDVAVDEKLKLEKELNDPSGDYQKEKTKLTKQISDMEATPDSPEKQATLVKLHQVLKELNDDHTVKDARVTLLAHSIKHSPIQAKLNAASTESDEAVKARTQVHDDLKAATAALTTATTKFAVQGDKVKLIKGEIKTINQEIESSRRRALDTLRDFLLIPAVAIILLIVATALYTGFYGSVLLEFG